MKLALGAILIAHPDAEERSAPIKPPKNYKDPKVIEDYLARERHERQFVYATTPGLGRVLQATLAVASNRYGNAEEDAAFIRQWFGADKIVSLQTGGALIALLGECFTHHTIQGHIPLCVVGLEADVVLRVALGEYLAQSERSSLPNGFWYGLLSPETVIDPYRQLVPEEQRSLISAPGLLKTLGYEYDLMSAHGRVKAALRLGRHLGLLDPEPSSNAE